MSDILLFGGSFDPVHIGHLIISRFVAETLRVERIVLIPAAVPPHKPDRRLAPAADRLAMCRLAVAGDPAFEVSEWELQQSGPNYTLNTVDHFRAGLSADSRIFWLIGMDSLAELSSWYRVEALVERCVIVTAARCGFDDGALSRLAGRLSPPQIERLRQHILPTPRIDVSATDIRARVAAGHSIRHLVPEPVERYIAQRGLYQHADQSSP